MKLLSYLASLAVFVGPHCAAEPTLSPLADDEGYLALNIVIQSMVPESVKLESAELFGAGHLVRELKSGENFHLIKLPAGEYSWSRIQVNNSYYFNIDDQNFNVSVLPGKINYSGHLLIEIFQYYGTAYFNYVNRSSQVIDALEGCCAELSKQYPLVFTGTSPDPFIDFYHQLLAQE